MAELTSPRLTAKEVEDMQRPLALDLTAAYAVMRDDMLELVGRAEREGWTPDYLVAQMSVLLGPEDSPESVLDWPETDDLVDKDDDSDLAEVPMGQLGEMLIERRRRRLVAKALNGDLSPYTVMRGQLRIVMQSIPDTLYVKLAVMPVDSVWKIDVGEIAVWGGYLCLRKQKTNGKWVDFVRLGKAPTGWTPDDGLTAEQKAKIPEEWQDKWKFGEPKKKPAAEPGQEPKPKASKKHAYTAPEKDTLAAESWVSAYAKETGKTYDEACAALGELDSASAVSAIVDAVGEVSQDYKDKILANLPIMQVVDQHNKAKAQTPTADSSDATTAAKIAAIAALTNNEHVELFKAVKQHMIDDGADIDDVEAETTNWDKQDFWDAANKYGLAPLIHEELKETKGPAPKEGASDKTSATWNQLNDWAKNYPEDFDLMMQLALKKKGFSDTEAHEIMTSHNADEKVNIALGYEMDAPTYDVSTSNPFENANATKTSEGFPKVAPMGKAAIEALTKPPAIPEYKDTGKLGGTTGAKKIEYTDPESGEKVTAVYKTGASPEHAAEEHQANVLYRAAGVAVPKSMLYDDNGTRVMVTKFLDKARPYDQLDSTEKDTMRKQMQKHFVVDALLGNWDVTGADFDNALFSATGMVVRIDNGGALRYRAQGAAKGGSWSEDVVELETMRDPSKLAGKMCFKDVTDADVADQIKELLPKQKAIMDSIVDPKLKQVMEGRFNYLKAWKPKPAAKPKPKAAGAEAPAEKKQTAAAKFGSVVESTPKYDLPPVRAKHRAAFRSYQGSGYISLNSALRSYNHGGYGTTIEAMDDYFSQCPEVDLETISKSGGLMRGTSEKFLQKVMQGMAFPAFKVESMADLDKKGKSGKTVRQMLSAALTGANVFDQGYMSTSWQESTAENFMKGAGEISHSEGGHVFLTIRGKTKAAHVNTVSGHGMGEGEWLLPRGTAFKIEKVDFMPKSHGVAFKLDVRIVEEISGFQL